MKKILIIDDEVKICEFVQAYLQKSGFFVECVYNGKEALNKFRYNNYDLIVLDRMLPDITGEEICTYIRKASNVPIIMLTAKIEDYDRIEGFTLGCDDYLCKPFNVNELVLRVKAILKRTTNVEERNDQTEEIIKCSDNFIINMNSLVVTLDGKEVNLTNSEFKILYLMATNPTKVFTRDELLDYVNSEKCESTDRAIDSHIKNLRQKLDIKNSDDKIIQTVYGVGYRFGIQK